MADDNKAIDPFGGPGYGSTMSTRFGGLGPDGRQRRRRTLAEVVGAAGDTTRQLTLLKEQLSKLDAHIKGTVDRLLLQRNKLVAQIRKADPEFELNEVPPYALEGEIPEGNQLTSLEEISLPSEDSVALDPPTPPYEQADSTVALATAGESDGEAHKDGDTYKDDPVKLKKSKKANG